ncbi:ROK family protein [Microbacterium lacus]|uniref:ROK family protein n=1 Tax=Microbacterium lacus TaxID=415217 RepID=A0ABN2FXA2_9MICO
MLGTLCVDIGGTKLAAAVCDGEGALSHVFAVDTPADATAAQRVLLDLCEVTADEFRSTGGTLASAGIACGGPLDVHAGVILSPPNLPGWDEVHVRAAVESRIGVRAALRNDADAVVLGATRWGRYAGVRNVVYLTISSGIGAGVVMDGRLITGRSGNSSELGHTVLVVGGRLCACGRSGCAEAYVSGHSIARRAEELISAGVAPTLGRGAPITAKDVYLASSQDRDPVAVRLWDESTRLIGELVANALNTFEPDLVLLGGGVTLAGEQFIEPVRAAAHDAALPGNRQTPVCIIQRPDRAALIGAGAVGIALIDQEYR